MALAKVKVAMTMRLDRLFRAMWWNRITRLGMFSPWASRTKLVFFSSRNRPRITRAVVIQLVRLMMMISPRIWLGNTIWKASTMMVEGMLYTTSTARIITLSTRPPT